MIQAPSTSWLTDDLINPFHSPMSSAASAGYVLQWGAAYRARAGAKNEHRPIKDQGSSIKNEGSRINDQKENLCILA